jgi:hypothetical protein
MAVPQLSGQIRAGMGHPAARANFLACHCHQRQSNRGILGHADFAQAH